MKTIFEQGAFLNYSLNSSIRLSEAMSPIVSSTSGNTQTTVFISHKHEDLEDLKGVLCFLEQHYGVKAYIDSQDPLMPQITSAKTAYSIRERINDCDRFIFLATNGAIESKWCNWELGYGDAKKFQKHIALFPLKPKGVHDREYKGSEYMTIYPYICYFDGTEKDSDGNPISKGYYVSHYENKSKTNIIIPLAEWLKKSY